MSTLQLPEDLIAFLDAGKQLKYDPAACEAGAVTLLTRSKLKLRTFGAQCGETPYEDEDPHPGPGVYLVPGVDLIESCTGDYEPEGLLVWLPDERSFAVWDSSHDYLLVFGPGVSWTEIARSPAQYINAQWEFEDLERAPADFLKPWPRYPHQ